MADEQKKEMVLVVFHEDAALNFVHFPKGTPVEVPKDYWLSEGHRHGVEVTEVRQAVKAVHTAIRNMDDDQLAKAVAAAQERDDANLAATVRSVPADPPTVEDKHKVSPLHGGAAHRKHLIKKGDA